MANAVETLTVLQFTHVTEADVLTHAVLELLVAKMPSAQCSCINQDVNVPNVTLVCLKWHVDETQPVMSIQSHTQVLWKDAQATRIVLLLLPAVH